MSINLRNQDTRGYTFAEVLIVLLCLSVVLSVVAHFGAVWSQRADKTSFLRVFTEDLLTAQQHALTTGKTVAVRLYAESGRYRMYTVEETLADRTFSTEDVLFQNSAMRSFRFDGEGDIAPFGSIFVTVGGVLYRLTFTIGKGEWYVTELS